MSALKLVEDAFVHDLQKGDDVLPYYADWLRDHDLWTRGHVYRHVIRYPRADWPRLLYAMWAQDQGDFETGDMILAAYPESRRYRELKTVQPSRYAYQNLDWVHKNFIKDMNDLGQMGVVAAISKGFISELYTVGFDFWKAHGPETVSKYPIILVKLADGAFHEEDSIGRGWRCDLYGAPAWFQKAFQEWGSPPFRRDRKEAEAHTSDVLIWWARKQAGLEDE